MRKGIAAESEQMLRAAERVLDRGWFLFGCVNRDKKPFKGSHCSLHTLNNERGTEALHRWQGCDSTKPAMQPSILSDAS